MAPRILFCGDTHGPLNHIGEAFDKYCGAAAVIHLGDFELAEPLVRALPKQVHDCFWWIPGNHDFDEARYWQALNVGGMAARCLHAAIIDLGGVRIAGLGGVFKGRIWYQPKPPVYQQKRDQVDATRYTESIYSDPLYVRSAILPEHIEKLGRERADVLVMHEAPSCHRYGFEVIDELADRMKVSLVVHGHHHVDYVSTINSGRTRVMGVGLCGVSDFEGNRLRASGDREGSHLIVHGGTRK